MQGKGVSMGSRNVNGGARGRTVRQPLYDTAPQGYAGAMNTIHPRLPELFDQLGLPSDEASIQHFLRTQAPLPDNMRLEDAPCWTPAQARLLCEALAADADWAPVVDRLNVALHAPPQV